MHVPVRSRVSETLPIPDLPSNRITLAAVGSKGGRRVATAQASAHAPSKALPYARRGRVLRATRLCPTRDPGVIRFACAFSTASSGIGWELRLGGQLGWYVLARQAFQERDQVGLLRFAQIERDDLLVLLAREAAV